MEYWEIEATLCRDSKVVYFTNEGVSVFCIDYKKEKRYVHNTKVFLEIPTDENISDYLNFNDFESLAIKKSYR